MLHARHHQSALRVNGATKIDDIEYPHSVTEAVRVDLREFLQSLDDGVADEIIDRDVHVDLSFLKGLLRLLAESLDTACVSTEHMGELGRVLEGVVHRLGDELAHVGHLLDLELLAFSGKVLGVGRFPDLEVGALDHSADSGACGRSLETSVGHHSLGESGFRSALCGYDVTFDYAAVRACAGDLGGVHAFFGGQFAGSWGDRGVGGNGSGRRACRSARCRCRGHFDGW